MAAKQSRLAEAMPYLSDVATSAIVFVGFRVSKRPPSPGALVGLVLVALGGHWGDLWPDSPSPRSRARRLAGHRRSGPPADGQRRPDNLHAARQAAGVPGCASWESRGRWIGRSPLLEVDVATDPDQPFAAVDTPAGRSRARCWTPSHTPGTCAEHRPAAKTTAGSPGSPIRYARTPKRRSSQLDRQSTPRRATGRHARL
jgi:hypothetical protein